MAPKTTQVTQTTCARRTADWKSAIASARGTAQAAHNTAVLLKPVASAARFRALSALAGSLRSEVAALEAEFRSFKSGSCAAQHAKHKGKGKGKGQACADAAPLVCSSDGGKPSRRRHRPKKRVSSAPAEPGGLALPALPLETDSAAVRRESVSAPPLARMDVDRRDRSPRRGHGTVKSGDDVIISGLTNQQRLNGACGVAVSFDESSARWAVRHGTAGECIKVKADNLTVCPRLTAEEELS